MRELRFNPPLTGQWIMVSAERKKRPPWRPKNFCPPFCPGTEETGYGWEVLLLPNRFPMLSFEPLSRRKLSSTKRRGPLASAA